MGVRSQDHLRSFIRACHSQPLCDTSRQWPHGPLMNNNSLFPRSDCSKPLYITSNHAKKSELTPEDLVHKELSEYGQTHPSQYCDYLLSLYH